MAISLLDLLTGAIGPIETPQLVCVQDEALPVRFAASPQDFGRKWSLLETENVNTLEAPRIAPDGPSAWAGRKRRVQQRRYSCERLTGNLAKVLQRRLFPFEVGLLRNVLLDHLERIFDFAFVYHDFYAGALLEHGGPLQHRASLMKRLSEFVIGEEGDAEGYAYPQDPQEVVRSPKDISPTSALELVGNFFYHAHGREQCTPHHCGTDVPILRLQRVAPLNMRKAFCNYYHFTTVALARIVTLRPRLMADSSILVLIPHPNKKGQQSPYIRESLRLLGLTDDRVMSFPPCRVVLVEELLVAGAGPRSSFGRDGQGRARAIMADVADEAPSRRVRHAVLAAIERPVPSDILLIDRRERRRISNLPEVLDVFGKLRNRNHTLIYCENLTFVEQISFFASASAAVAVSGACLANSLYMREDALVLDLVPVQNYMGADVVMPLECGITWFWTLTSNVKLRYRSLMLPEGDLDADTIHVPVASLAKILRKELSAADVRSTRPGSRGAPGTTCEREATGRCHDTAACQMEVHGWWRDLKDSYQRRASGGNFVTSLAKLRHDIEMLENLQSLVDNDTLRLFRALYAAAEPRYAARPTAQAFEVRLPKDDERHERFGKVQNRPLYIAPGVEKKQHQALLAPGIVRHEVKQHLASHGYAVMDGVLSKVGQELWRKHLQQSTMYYHLVSSSALLIADMDTLASNGLLHALVMELQKALSDVFGAFCEALAAKVMADGPLVIPTGNVTATTVFMVLWLVPDVAGSGPVMQLTHQDGSAISVSYAVNRAVLWREDGETSSVQWQPDSSWKNGYLQRRIHFLLRWHVDVASGQRRVDG